MKTKHRPVGLSADGETLVIRKFHGDFGPPANVTDDWLAANRELLRTGVGLDCETTGLRHSEHEVIEIALRPFVYRHDTGEIVRVDEGYTSLHDPGVSLSDEIRAVTGLTDEDLRGRSIDWSRVDALLGAADVVIAHNASFDRPFVDARASASRGRLWACSLSHVDWSAKGLPSQKLEVLSLLHGFFVDAHRAMNDVNAMLRLLGHVDPSTGRAYLYELLANCTVSRVRIAADGAPFAAKDALKARGYRWDGQERCWHIRVAEDRVATELAWLEKDVYGGPFTGRTVPLPCTENFSVGEGT